MNDKLKDYATNPDPEVWERIEKSMRQRGARRQAWSAVAGATIVALAIVGVVFWPKGKTDVAVPLAMPEMAQAMPRNEARVVAEQQEVVVEKAMQSEPKTVRIELAKAESSAGAQPAALPSTTQTEGLSAAAKTVVASQVVTKPVASAPVTEEARVPTPVVSEPQPQDLPVAETTEPVKPSVKATVNNGNEDTILWLPNIFVPGSDDAEINLFRARLNHPGDVLTNYRMNVFNRSGNLVFVSNDINAGWDGKYKGRDLPQSTYVYVIYYTDKDGFHHQRKGTITLVR